MKGIATIVMLTLMSGLVFGATIYVGSGQTYTTIQAGINAAVNGDTVIVKDGTYTGAANKNLDFSGRNIVLKSETGPANCIINCQSSGRGFYFHSGETNDAVVEGFYITGGTTSAGAGVNCNSSSPTFKNCIIEDCINTSFGGGAYALNSNPTFFNCVFYANSSKWGGAVYVSASNITINSCIFAFNEYC